MINNIKEIIKNRDQSQNNTSSTSTNSSSSAESKLNRLDQEIIQNYKSKLLNFEIENNKLNEELNSTRRNFEALCLKNKEDVNLIRKLEEEINYLKIKLKSQENNFSSNSNNIKDENEIILKNYITKIESLNQTIKGLESKMNNSVTNHLKFQEKENFYKTFISKLEEKNKNLIQSNSDLEKENIKLKKENKLLNDDKNKTNSKLEDKEKEFNELLQNFENLKNFLENKKNSNKDNDELINKLRKEKDLIEKLLIESRNKIRTLDDIIKDTDIKNKKLIELLNQLKSNYEDLNSNFNSLKNENEDLKLELEQCSNENQKLKNLLNDSNSNTNNELEKIKCKMIQIIVKYENNFQNLIKNISGKIEDKINLNKNKINDLNIKIFDNLNDKNNKISQITTELNSNLNNYNTIISDKNKIISEKEKMIINLENKINCLTEKNLTNELKNQNFIENISTLEKSIKSLLYEVDENKFLVVDNEKKFRELLNNLDKKVNKKRNKIYSIKLQLEKLKKENEDFNLNLEDVNKNKEKDGITKSIQLVTEINFTTSTPVENENKDKIKLENFYSQISTMCYKLKLSLKTIYLILTCRSCSDENQKLQILECGHSLCKNCIKLNKKCFECKSQIEKSFPIIENINFNDIITRFKFTRQISNDIDLIINQIKENLN